MAHIGVVMTGLTGNFNSSLSVAFKLKAEGHKVTCLSVLDIKKKIEPYGLPYVQLPEINFYFSDENLSHLRNSSWIKKLNYHRKNKKKILENSRNTLGLDKYERIISGLKMDKALIDQELHDIIFVCYKLKIPITLLNSFFSNKMGLGLTLPPLRTNISPRKSLKGSVIGIWSSWMFIKLKVQARIIANRLTFKGYRRAALKKYAIASGFPFSTIISTNLPQLFSYTNLPVISLTMAEMDFPHRPAKNFSYVGPMVYENRVPNTYINEEIEITDVIELKKRSNKKLIYCSASSLLKSDISFVQKMIKAVEGQEEWLMIISLGGKLSMDLSKIKSSNLYIYWVSQMEVLKYSDCCITPAGINSISECVHFSVPLIVFSLKVADQNGNANRVDYHGLGIMGDRDKDSYLEIRRKIQRIFDEPSYSNKMKVFNQKYLEYQQRALTPLLN
jgi:UDP:flavonoid glycosyltransferase YjiC (YdhE family)